MVSVKKSKNNLPDTAALKRVVGQFKDKRIGVIGDLMLDHFIYGDAERISPEAPVPVVIAKEDLIVPGGAANVARNIRALGGVPFAVGVIGADEAGEKFVHAMQHEDLAVKGCLRVRDRVTTEKTRVAARGQQIVRVDREVTDEVTRDVETRLCEVIRAESKRWDAMLLSDYAKGVLSKRVVEEAIACARKRSIPVLCDPKRSLGSYFRGVSLITPNQHEALALSGEETSEKAARKIHRMLACHVLVKEGARGMLLLERGTTLRIPARQREVFDSVGAGDTAIATLSLALSAGASLLEAAYLANAAGGLVVCKRGTATITPDELLTDIGPSF